MKKNNQRLGFSLIELTGVIGVLALIMTVVMVNFNRMRSQSRDANRLNDVKEMQAALELYYGRTNSYPTSITPGENFSLNNKNYLEPVPTNPTPRRDGNCGDNEYTYAALADNSDYTINFCLGNRSSEATRGANLMSKNGLNALKGLVSWWKFEEGEGTVIYDTSGNQNNCHIVTRSYDPRIFSWEDISACKTGFCGKFLGTDDSYIKCGKGNTVDDNLISNDFIVNSGSVSLWFRVNNDISNADHYLLEISSSDGEDNIKIYYAGHVEIGRKIFFTGKKDGIQNINLSPESNMFPEAESWYFVAATWDQTGAYLYIKGPDIDFQTNDTSESKTQSFPLNNTKLSIGSIVNLIPQATLTWNGYIDDVRLYSRALSAAEVQATYDSLK